MEKKLKTNHPLYGTWCGIMRRCHKPNDSHYKYYGNKGITVAKQWHKFWNFVYDIDNRMPNGHLLYRKDYQLDKDKKGGKIYSLENCMVITAEENRKMAGDKQKRKIVAFDDDGEIKFESLSAAQRQLNIKRQTLCGCLKRGNVHRETGYRFKYIS
ncbi:TPA: hypothetical protein ACGW7B_005662 [Bacillus nitratireducens]|nr:hypothetical protein bcere0029_4430 [Bacillus cereus AH1272]EEL90486.1 hypothetical protein bcere0030_55950 [Bacillus cereus AH1273]GCF75090.1 hypothetical protein BC2926_26310 [Bacillus cereus]